MSQVVNLLRRQPVPGAHPLVARTERAHKIAPRPLQGLRIEPGPCDVPQHSGHFFRREVAAGVGGRVEDQPVRVPFRPAGGWPGGGDDEAV